MALARICITTGQAAMRYLVYHIYLSRDVTIHPLLRADLNVAVAHGPSPPPQVSPPHKVQGRTAAIGYAAQQDCGSG